MTNHYELMVFDIKEEDKEKIIDILCPNLKQNTKNRFLGLTYNHLCVSKAGMLYYGSDYSIRLECTKVVCSSHFLAIYDSELGKAIYGELV